jgi:predicted helicase
MTSIQSIRTFESLLGYLGDVLQWPVSSDEIEDMTYEYHPAELGITGEAAVNITNIVRIRPFHSKQPWSVFYIEFASGNLPVVVLRRVLNNLIVRQRATKSDHQRWNMHDLLFISSHGAATDRHVTFAHFAEAPDGTQLPTLRVLGWDGDDSKLRMQDVEQRLQKYFMFPADAAGVAAWPQTWNAAFTLRPHETIKTTKQLSVALARLARDIRDRLKTVMSYETESGQYAKLMASFKSALIHDLVSDDFADMYAQTIAYGLLSTRIANPTQKSTQDFAANLQTNPFLRELMQTFLTMGGRDSRMHVDFDELGINEIIDLLNAAQMDEVLLDFNNRNAQEDPVIHFYELFLKEYDAKKRMARGVFYTPKPVVGYIVRSVHELLQRDFGLADGLADTTTWDEMLASGRVERLPLRDVLSGSGTETIDPQTPFVQILDPATGTGTFLVEVIDVIHRTMLAKWSAKRPAEQKTLWNDYVEQHLLPRVFGYELMMAPYAIAHLKIGLKLAETGYTFNGTQRANVYLTNALEPGQAQLALTGIIPALAHEAAAVNTVKRETRFTVVVGNPPYSVSISQSTWLIQHLEEWKTGLNETKIDLNREELKFLRFAELCNEFAGAGLIGFITNRDLLDGIAKRRIREHLGTTFRLISIIDLNGDVKGNIADGNVFDIEQGVAIVVLSSHHIEQLFRSTSRIGTREQKYHDLTEIESINSGFIKSKPIAPYFRWIPYLHAHSAAASAEYSYWPSLNSIFSLYSAGIESQRDKICIAYSREELQNNISKIEELSDSDARNFFDLGDDGRDWSLGSAKADLKRTGPNNKYITEMLYRPLDFRFTYWTGKTKGFLAYPRREVMQHFINNRNLGLIFNRQIAGANSSHFFVTRKPICKGTFYLGNKGVDYLAPLYTYTGKVGSNNLAQTNNFEEQYFRFFTKHIFLPDLPETSESIFSYLYASAHSPTYRTRYAEFLKIDFPRIPLPGGPDVFHALVPLGEQLVALHLMESPLLDTPITHTVGDNWTVGKVGYADGTVWIDGKGTKAAYAAGTTGFVGVPEEVWNFHIGGYQVCEKWLKDRKNRTLSADDIAHYQKIVVALHETIRLMAEIDVVIEEHGGWPGAFHVADVSVADEPARPQFGQVPAATSKRKAAEDKDQGSFLDE